MDWIDRHKVLYFGAIIAFVVLFGWFTSRLWAFNHFEVADSGAVLLFRFEGTTDFHRNSIDPNHLTNAGGERQTSGPPEGGSWVKFTDGETMTAMDANLPDVWDGGDITLCFWFRGDQWWSSTHHWLLRKDDTNKTCFRTSVYDAGATEHFRLELGYDNGQSADTYDHASDLGAGDWYWAGVSIDADDNVFITIHNAAGQVGTDVNTALLHPLNDEDATWTLAGVGVGTGLDELVVFDGELSETQMDAVRAGTYRSGEGPYTWYCHPTGGAWYNLGNAPAPWPVLETTSLTGNLARVAAGDTIKACGGYQGEVDFSALSASEAIKGSPVFVEPNGTSEPNFYRLNLTNAQGWTFRGTDTYKLHFSPENDGNAIGDHDANYPPAIISAGNGGSQAYLTFENCEFETMADVSAWDTNDWTLKSWAGTNTYCPLTITGCVFENLSYVFQNIGSAAGTTTITDTIVRHFSGDCLYAGGGHFDIDNLSATYVHDFNRDLFPGSSYWHVDFLQFSPPAHFTLNVRNCYFNLWPDANTPGSHGYAQGIFAVGNIDEIPGPTQNVIANCLIATWASPHALEIGYDDEYDSDVNDLLIANNVLCHPYGINHDTPALPYIRDNGTGDVRNEIYIINNYASSWITGAGFTAANNVDADSYDCNVIFVNYDDGDFNLPVGSPLIDAGTADYNAPTTDLAGDVRDATPDVGPYEYGASPPPTKYLMADALFRWEDLLCVE